MNDARDLYNALFCYEEEYQCWFNVGMAPGFGWTLGRFRKAVKALSRSGKALVRTEPPGSRGSWYARRRAVPWTFEDLM
jgi:hypothetical protein